VGAATVTITLSFWQIAFGVLVACMLGGVLMLVSDQGDFLPGPRGWFGLLLAALSMGALMALCLVRVLL
jgi:hypothetical protein